MRESRNEAAEKIIISAESLRRTCDEGAGVKRGVISSRTAVAIVTYESGQEYRSRNCASQTANALGPVLSSDGEE